MDSKEKLSLIWKMLFSGALVVAVCFFAKYDQGQKQTALVAPSLVKNAKVIYPAQYSDDHITENAVAADPRFKDLALFDKNDLVANVISSIKPNPALNIQNGPEKGTWLWTPVLDIDHKYRDSIISGAKKNGITSIYMSLDSYLDIYVLADGPDKTAKKLAFDNTVQNFIATAEKNGIVVDAEGGWRNWAESGNSYKAFAILDYVKNFNQSHSAKFRGFQYDVEPYLLDSYQTNKAGVLSNYLDLVGETVSRLNGSDLQFSVVIPEFYDGSYGETPSFSYLGKTGFALDHLLTLLDRRPQSKIIVMSYRNFSQGDDGSIDVSKDEVLKADGHSTKVVIAQETGDVQPPYITFYKTTKPYFNKQLSILQKAFSSDKSFDGVAIHYINAFMNLK